jgi:protocatechuate 3,4-dioxygenase beta subunit
MNRFARLGLIASMVLVVPAHAGHLDGYVRAANGDEHVEDIRINIEDRRLVNVVTSFMRSDPNGTVHTLKVYRDLQIKATFDPYIRLELISTKGAPPRVLARTVWASSAAETTAVNFSVCGQRMIVVMGGTRPGRCKDLPPMAKPDPWMGDCSDFCSAPYEGMPAFITSRARIAPPSEPGEPLTITGRVTGADGRPRPGIIVYAYHTNRLGIYPPPVPPRSSASSSDGQLRGWARTDSEGRYLFETIRPSSYPNTKALQHVHMHIIEPGCGTYYIEELQFSDDPMRKQLSADDLKHMEQAVIETPRKTTKGWEVTRDIRLGENVKNYKPCATANSGDRAGAR